MIFASGDNIGVAGQKELYFLHAMVVGCSLNAVVFFVRNLQRIFAFNMGDISIRGLISTTAKHLGFTFNEENFLPIFGKTRCDMECLVSMGMINHSGDTYSLMIHNRQVLYLPNS